MAVPFSEPPFFGKNAARLREKWAILPLRERTLSESGNPKISKIYVK